MANHFAVASGVLSSFQTKQEPAPGADFEVFYKLYVKLLVQVSSTSDSEALRPEAN